MKTINILAIVGIIFGIILGVVLGNSLYKYSSLPVSNPQFIFKTASSEACNELSWENWCYSSEDIKSCEFHKDLFNSNGICVCTLE